MGVTGGLSRIRGHHPQRPMKAFRVVEADPVGDHPQSAGLALEAMPVHARLFERADRALDHAILLRAVWGDELLLQAGAHAETSHGLRREAIRRPG